MPKEKNSKLVEPHAQSLLEKKDVRPSTQSEYYDYMLRKEKLKSLETNEGDFFTANKLSNLEKISDLEKLELQILSRLCSLPDDDPYLLNYFNITKTRDRQSCAKKLGEKAYRKQLMESAINALVPPAATAAIYADRGGKEATRSQINAFGF